MLDPDFLAAIGHPARLQALILLEQEPAGAAELAARLGVPAHEARDHLAQLAEASLIEPVSGGDDGLWRTRAPGWADLAELLARTADGASDDVV